MNSKHCPCCSKQPFDVCCSKFINNHSLVTSPLELMRSRYSAYVTDHLDYIEQTMTPPASLQYERQETSDWNQKLNWLGLRIVAATDNWVEFKAYYQVAGKVVCLHEKSLFTQQNNKWYYQDAEFTQTDIVKLGRNEPCVCGSGNKYKHCCWQ